MASSPDRKRRRERGRLEGHGADASMTAYLLLEQALCDCTSACECGWDDDPEQEDDP